MEMNIVGNWPIGFNLIFPGKNRYRVNKELRLVTVLNV